MKKTIKKKAIKKKVVKNTSKKEVAKSKKQKIFVVTDESMGKLYEAISICQRSGKKIRICLEEENLIPTIENILKDSEIKFTKREFKNNIKYTLKSIRNDYGKAVSQKNLDDEELNLDELL
jgi:hypothetical protein